MTFKLGVRSQMRLAGVHPDLIRVIERAIYISPQDFTVIEGVRSPQRQAQLYAQGRTTPGPIVTWVTHSNHFTHPDTGYGHAVDLAPFPVDYSEKHKFDVVAKAMLEAAKELGVKIRFGGDWDQDGKLYEKGETDIGHFELAHT